MPLSHLVSPNGTVVVMPVRRIVSVSGHVAFSCVAEGGPNNTIQWSLSDANLPGENDASFSVTRVDAANGGNYTCTVRNRAGVEQDTAELFGECIQVTTARNSLSRNEWL